MTKMNIAVFFSIIALVFMSCEGKLKKTPLIDGTFETKVKLNDSIILINRYDSNEKLNSKDYENLNTKIHKIFYYDEFGALKESAIGYPDKTNTNFSYVDCKYFDSKGNLKSRKILNSDYTVLAHYYCDSTLNVFRKVFYGELTKRKISEISCTENKIIDLENTDFLNVNRKGNLLYLKPSWFKGIHKRAMITINSYDGINRNFISEVVVENKRDLCVDLRKIDTFKVVSITVSVEHGSKFGMPLLVPISILIDDFNHIPENNLFPVIVKDGQIRSGKYLLEGGKAT
ncbi:hypothetical protein [Fluviicola taffensis]|uniref:Lipoprotein n=1 Tax=Fluviicola taffensis (strain DSM 16823 / NCIMB 13979 / RW262) TaxID=755732 RepID=F2ID34_FLUTR|nr:hypothetical protein [Fluviicola taffensis]AEA44428.1 hypothetical protein Fluta_2443 [Fluviicola taffensis DSM 16823]